MTTDYNSRYVEFAPLGRIAFEVIAQMFRRQAHIEPKWWSGPRVSGKHKTYRVEWYSPEYDDTGDYITLDEDGYVFFYTGDEIKEIKIPPLHNRGWIDKIVESGAVEEIAVASVNFFKELKNKA
jgi:hypothetical protein